MSVIHSAAYVPNSRRLYTAARYYVFSPHTDTLVPGHFPRDLAVDIAAFHGPDYELVPIGKLAQWAGQETRW